MTERQVQLVIATPGPDRLLRVNMVIEGRTVALVFPPHVAASAVATICDALAKMTIDS